MADTIHVSTRKGLVTARRQSGEWRIDPKIDFLGQPISLSLHDPRSGYSYACVNLGHFGQKLHRTRDGGATWEEIAPPAYPPQPEGVEDICPMRKTPIPWSLQMIWSLETGAEDGQLWCGTIPGGLFVSRDHGDSWQIVESLWNRPERKKWFGGGYDYPGIHSICVDPRNRRHLSVAVSCGGVWHSTDDGATWEGRAQGMRASYMPPDLADDPDTQDAHRMVRCPGQPDRLWVQHHNGIFRSDDNAMTWHDCPNGLPSTFGFAVAVHPRNPDRAWFAPAVRDEVRVPVDNRFVVSRTDDAGKTFQVLGSGLPEPPGLHLVYRHGLDVDDTGDVLAMGSTTGSLWISENGGDHWERLSAELAPIYSVRIC
ncbi:exo-alpha-sialidase [bacterium]|nr:exo-alpha-sialidase [bacterium]